MATYEGTIDLAVFGLVPIFFPAPRGSQAGMAPRQITTSNSTLAYDLLQSIHDIQSNQNNASDIAQTVGLYFFGFLTLFGVYDVWRHQRWERAAGVKCLKGMCMALHPSTDSRIRVAVMPLT